MQKIIPIMEKVITVGDVQRFLEEFKVKARTFGIIYRDDRDKNNLSTLLELGINNTIRDDIIYSLEAIDYSEGPIPDNLNHIADMWVFGKDYNGVDLYIKISVGKRSMCISFHKAAYRLQLPFKND